MKKTIALILALSMLLALSACGSQSSPSPATTPSQAEEPTPEPTEEPVEEKIVEITIGEKIVTDSYELTLVDAQVGKWFHNAGEKEPTTWWNGDPNVRVNLVLKNKDKSEIELKKSVKCTVDYDDGYTFGCDLYYPIYQKDYSSATFEPLKEDEIKFEGKVVDEVSTNKDAPLSIILTLWDGAQYRYTFTDDNYNEGTIK